jgi:hypothetical protein
VSLTFNNEYSAPVSISILWYSPGCPDGGDWELAGWYNLDTGQGMTVFFGDLDDINRYWYFNAEAIDGAYWAGDVVHDVCPLLPSTGAGTPAVTLRPRSASGRLTSAITTTSQ